ncbi:hypothetical protein HPP92_015997 [Vanilla planifolia]|uniref:Pentatricopeptide repeat-containing protein n=1 Tax=Vanilla planifolia TaxID=51239 RepID=A0A835QIW7_VANPL|nr:hypothetical protein HPP92_015997 [Vanilla planifolia]
MSVPRVRSFIPRFAFKQSTASSQNVSGEEKPPMAFTASAQPCRVHPPCHFSSMKMLWIGRRNDRSLYRNFSSDKASLPMAGLGNYSRACVMHSVDEICRILDNIPLGTESEDALSAVVPKPSAELVIGVLRRVRSFRAAMDYFRWSEKVIGEPHRVEVYNSLLLSMANHKSFESVEKVFQEMSLLGFGPSPNACLELVTNLVKSGKVKEGVDLIEKMRKFSFRPAFSAYTTLIGALAYAHEKDLALGLFNQMQEMGYEVNVTLFTTLVRIFARDGQLDSAISLLDQMKSQSFDADIVLYNVCIDCFGKEGKVEMAWKFLHEMRTQGIEPDDVTYTSMLGVLCKANRLDEAIELFEQMEIGRKFPCAFAYNIMISGYGSAGRFDEAYMLLERLREKGCIPSVVSYNCILTCLKKKGIVDEALRVFDEMRKDAEPNVYTYNLLIDILFMAGKLKMLLKFGKSWKMLDCFPIY